MNFTRTLEIAGTSGFVQPLRLVQYDDTLPVGVFELVENGQPFDIPAGAKAKVRMRKADGKGVYNDAVISGDTVQVVFTQQMTAAFGVGFLNIELSYDGGVKSSEPVQVVVLENAVQQGAIESSDEFLTLDEIVKQVEMLRQQTATDAAAAASSKTAAASSATAAQSARAGAEAAESRVNAIVAGNESYTKRQSRDMFARALKATAEKAEKLEIYPDDGSNVAVTAYGYTEQAGTGDPSPTNVREITVGGLQANLLPPPSILGKYNIESGNLTPSSDGNISSEKIACKPNTKYFFEIKISASTSVRAHYWAFNGAYLGNELIIQDTLNPSKSFTTPASAQKMAFSIYSSGATQSSFKESMVVYGSSKVPYTPYTGASYGTVAKTKGASEINKLIPLTDPLCEGDTVETCAKSGCDKRIIIRGDETDGTWSGYKSSTTYTLVLKSKGAGGTTVFSDKFTPGTADIGNIFTNASGDIAFIFPYENVKSVEDGKSALSQMRPTVWYRSTEYTEENDIPVCLETHVQGAFELDGTESGMLSSSNGAILVNAGHKMPGKAKGGANSGLCSIAKMQYLTAGSGFYFDPTSTNLWFGKLYAAEFGTYAEFQAKQSELYAAGTPAQFVYPLATPITYAHDPVYLEAYPDGNGKFTVSGEKLVSAVYNKSLSKAFEELQSAVLAMGANLSS